MKFNLNFFLSNNWMRYIKNADSYHILESVHCNIEILKSVLAIFLNTGQDCTVHDTRSLTKSSSFFACNNKISVMNPIKNLSFDLFVQ